MVRPFSSIDESVVRQLLQDQLPHFANLPIARVASSGTDNILFRLGEHLVLRMPQRESAVALLSKELDWISRFSDLPLCVPQLHARGRLALSNNCEFGVFDWLQGGVASRDQIAQPYSAALTLAEFLTALHKKEIKGAPLAGVLNANRGVALPRLTPITLKSINAVADEIDVDAATSLWESACATPFTDSPVWLHGDLKDDNLIADNGELVGVIDWGLCAVGDPAADYSVAWSWVQQEARDAFLNACELNAAQLVRAKAWALYGAVISLSYYRGGLNDTLCQQSRRTLAQLGLAGPGMVG